MLLRIIRPPMTRTPLERYDAAMLSKPRIFLIAGTLLLFALAACSQWRSAYVRADRLTLSIDPHGQVIAIWKTPAWESGIHREYAGSRLWWPHIFSFPTATLLIVPWWILCGGWLSLALPLWLVTGTKRSKAGAFPVQSTAQNQPHRQGTNAYAAPTEPQA